MTRREAVKLGTELAMVVQQLRDAPREMLRQYNQPVNLFSDAAIKMMSARVQAVANALFALSLADVGAAPVAVAPEPAASEAAP